VAPGPVPKTCGAIVQYHATIANLGLYDCYKEQIKTNAIMELCFDEFHVDIPNAV
jgi:hypothetical protein